MSADIDPAKIARLALANLARRAADGKSLSESDWQRLRDYSQSTGQPLPPGVAPAPAPIAPAPAPIAPPAPAWPTQSAAARALKLSPARFAAVCAAGAPVPDAGPVPHLALYAWLWANRDSAAVRGRRAAGDDPEKAERTELLRMRRVEKSGAHLAQASALTAQILSHSRTTLRRALTTTHRPAILAAIAPAPAATPSAPAQSGGQDSAPAASPADPVAAVARITDAALDAAIQAAFRAAGQPAPRRRRPKATPK